MFTKVFTFVRIISMETANRSWYRLRLVLIGLLIVSLLGPVNAKALLPSLTGYCFVDDTGKGSKSIFQFLDEGKAGEERTEKDVDDESEEKNLSEEIITSQTLAAVEACISSRIAYADRYRPSDNGLPIYLSHHSLLI